MPLIIDANNLLLAPMPQALAGLDEARLCQLLRGWQGPGGLPAIVVCDGSGRGRSLVQEVKLVFSGPMRTADEVIIDMINRHTAPRTLAVVSSDHQIRKAARRRRAQVFTSAQFVHELVIALSKPPGDPKKKPSQQPLSANDVEQWLDWFGISAADRPKGEKK